MFTINSNGPIAIHIYGQQDVLNKNFAISVPSGSDVEIHFYDSDKKSRIECDIDVETTPKIKKNKLDLPLDSPREEDLGDRKMMSAKKYKRIKAQLDKEIDEYFSG